MPILDPQPLLRAIGRIACDALGLHVRFVSTDRALLEDVILPAYAVRDDVRRVLFVGCARYTRDYATVFPHGGYSTIDPVPSRRRYGATRHIVDRLEHLDRHVPGEYLDLVICNGVFGWGLDARADCEAAFDACRRCLRRGGELVLGWNDVPERRPFMPESLAALARFEPVRFPALGVHRYLTATRNRHTYDFYARRT